MSWIFGRGSDQFNRPPFGVAWRESEASEMLRGEAMSVYAGLVFYVLHAVSCMGAQYLVLAASPTMAPQTVFTKIGSEGVACKL